MLKIAKFTFNPLSENTYLLHQNGEAVVIDPGMYQKHEQKSFDTFLKDHNLTLTKIVNTHCHLDHVAGVAYLQEKYQVPFFIPKGEVEVLKMAPVSAELYGLNLFQDIQEHQLIDEQNGTIELAGVTFQILNVPGHSPGHLAYYNEAEEVVISGDVLFQGSFGRYDLPGGDVGQLYQSIQTQLFGLPPQTKVLSGHGALTEIGQEKNTNPINTYK